MAVMFICLLMVLNIFPGCHSQETNKFETLDSSNFTQAINGRSAFVSFTAPWCGHCKKLKDTWDGLANSFRVNASIVIGNVDCTLSENRDLCKQFGIKSFPTLKFFDEFSGPRGEEYEGDRDQLVLFNLVNERFGPKCGVEYLDLCEQDERDMLNKYITMTEEERQQELQIHRSVIADAKTKFKEDIAALQQKYDMITDEKLSKIATVQPDIDNIERVISGLKHVERARKEAEELAAKRAARRAAIEAEEEAEKLAKDEF